MRKKEAPKEISKVGEHLINPLYASAKFRKRLLDYWSEVPIYADVARRLNVEFKCTITSGEIAYLIKKIGAKAVVNSDEVKKLFDESFGKLFIRWEKSLEMVDSLLKMYDKFKVQIEESDDAKQIILFLKLTPSIIQIAKEIREQLDFIKNQQETIKLEIKNNYITPIQINNMFSELENERFKKLKKLDGLQVYETIDEVE